MTTAEKTFAALSEAMEASVYKAYPDDYAKLPCVVFYEIERKPMMFADDEVFLTEARYLTEVYAKTAPEAEELSLRAEIALKAMGFVKTSEQDARSDEAQRRRSEGNSRYNLAQSTVRKKTAEYIFLEGID